MNTIVSAKVGAMGEKEKCKSQPEEEWGLWMRLSLAKFGMDRDTGGLDELDSCGRRWQGSDNHLNKGTKMLGGVVRVQPLRGPWGWRTGCL